MVTCDQTLFSFRFLNKILAERRPRIIKREGAEAAKIGPDLRLIYTHICPWKISTCSHSILRTSFSIFCVPSNNASCSFTTNRSLSHSITFDCMARSCASLKIHKHIIFSNARVNKTLEPSSYEVTELRGSLPCNWLRVMQGNITFAGLNTSGHFTNGLQHLFKDTQKFWPSIEIVDQWSRLGQVTT